MKKTFVTNLALLVFLNLLVKPFWVLGIDVSVQNAVGTAQYGLYATLLSFSITLNLLLDFGITNFNSRHIAQNKHLLQKYFSNIVVLKFLLGCLYAFVAIGTAFIFEYQPRQIFLLAVLVFNQFILSFILYLRSNLTGLHLFRADSFISVTDRVIAIILCGLALHFYDHTEPFRIEWFIYAQTIAYIITFTIAFILVRFKAKFLTIRFNGPFLLLLIKKSLPFAIFFLLMSLYTRVDIVMIERMLPDGKLQAGVYVQAFRIFDAVTMFGMLFANILLPIFSGMIKRKEPVEQLAVLSYFLIMVPTLIFTVGSVVYSSEIMQMLYREHYDLSAEIYKVLIIGFIAFSTTHIFGILLTANSNLKQLNYLATAGMIFNILLNLILIPRYQAWGAAVASLVTQCITAAIQLLLAAYFFKFHINSRNIGRVLLYTAALIVIFYSTHSLFHVWYYNFIFAVGLGSISSFAFRIVSPNVIIEIIRKGDV